MGSLPGLNGQIKYTQQKSRWALNSQAMHHLPLPHQLHLGHLRLLIQTSWKLLTDVDKSGRAKPGIVFPSPPPPPGNLEMIYI